MKVSESSSSTSAIGNRHGDQCVARPYLVAAAIVGAILVALLSGCGEGDSVSGNAAEGVTVTVTTPAPTTTTTTTPAPPLPGTATAPAPAPVSPARPAASPPKAAETGVLVPDVIGRNHQLAQDTMQARGLYNLAEEDATGQGRLLLFDRNWVVVSQRPAAGTRVDENAVIVLRSKKYGE